MLRRAFDISALTFVIVLGATAASAADLPTRKQAPAPAAAAYAPLYSWTGFYVGANVGGVWGTGDIAATGVSPGDALSAYFPSTLGGGPTGWLGGGQIGYNYQIGSAVVGAETDFDWTSLRRSGSFTSLATPLGPTLTSYGSSRLDWLGTLRARAGFAATADNRLLLYLTGGLAYGGGRTSSSVTANGTDLAWYGSNSPTKVGWTIGGGVEYAITNNISLRAEYLYYDLGKQTTIAAPNAAVLATPALNGVYLTTRTQFDGSIFRIGASYKF